MGLTLVVFAAYSLVAAASRTFVLERPTVLRRFRQICAVCFVGLGARLAFERR